MNPHDTPDRRLAPQARIAAWTSGAGPGGDSAFAAFRRAEVIRPGAEEILSTKAKT
jgi:hypothetical protein